MAAASAELMLPTRKFDLVAVDQLARLLHRGAGVAAGGVFDQQIDFAAEDAAFGVDLIERKLAADQFVLAERGVGAGQRVVEADLDGLVGQRLDHEWAGDLHGAERETGLAVWSAA